MTAFVEELYCSHNSVLSDSDDDVKTYSSKHACAAASDTFAFSSRICSSYLRFALRASFAASCLSIGRRKSFCANRKVLSSSIVTKSSAFACAMSKSLSRSVVNFSSFLICVSVLLKAVF